MRPILHGDVVAAARVLHALPSPKREGALRRMLRGASKADLFRKETGTSHPRWGDGSLMVAALSSAPPPEPRLNDVEYCRCMAMVFDGLIAWFACERAASHARN